MPPTRKARRRAPRRLPLRRLPWLGRVFAILLAASLAGLLAVPAAADRVDLTAVRRLLAAERPSARAAAVRRLAGLDDRAAVGLVVDTLEDEHPYVRRAAAGVLGALDERARPRLAALLGGHRDARVRAEACRTYALWADATGRAALRRALGDRDADVRAESLRWLAAAPDPVGEGADVRADVAAKLEDEDGGVRALALDALSRRPGATPPYLRLMRDPDSRVRIAALEGAVAGAAPVGGREGAAVAVLHGLDDAVWSVRVLAAALAGAVPDRRLLPALVVRLEDERLRVAEAAHASLVALTGIPFDPDAETWRAWLAGDGAGFDPAAGRVEATEGPVRPAGGHTIEAAGFLGLKIRSRHVAFVLDASGSMAKPLPDGRTRWQAASAELAGALDALPDGAEVNVYRFQDEVEAVFPRARGLSRAVRARIGEWLAATLPRGRTALFDGIAAALDDPALDTVVVLSDGAPSAGRFFTKTDLLEEIERWNRWRRARIDVVSIGTDGVARRWRDTLARIAEGSGGTWLAR